MSWLSDHLIQILALLAVVNVVASPLAEFFPPTTVLGKVLHVFVALNPLDIMKALRAVGGAAIPPLAMLLVLCGCGCSNGVPTPKTVATITEGVAFAVCVIGQDAQCNRQLTPWAACVVEIIQACGGDALSVAAVLDAHRAAEISDGLVSAPSAPGR